MPPPARGCPTKVGRGSLKCFVYNYIINKLSPMMAMPETTPAMAM